VKEGKPSQTAAMVACMRALADRGWTLTRGFRDPTAAQLIPPAWVRVLSLVDWLLRRMSKGRRHRALTRLDILPLRTLAIDAALAEALTGGCHQVVILGAGLDGRAHRMTELADVHVFEVDHPATQAYKRRKAAALPRTCRELSYIAVDFERDSLTEKLAESGHAADRPTAWIWEGVTMYLTDAALQSTLAAIASRFAPRSRLLAQYGEPRNGSRAGTSPLFLRPLLYAWSEPQIGARSRATMKVELERVGLRVSSDSGLADWASRYSAGEVDVDTARTRLAVAHSSSTIG
jgi:methyltransferase (TIGR00027 family)